MKFLNLNIYSLIIFILSGALFAEPTVPPIKFNKLKEMYSFYYLPFNLQFKVGEQNDDIFPMVADTMGQLSKVVSPDDMKKIESEWSTVRESWKKKSLFLLTPVNSGQKVRISQRLISHKIGINKSAMDHLSLSNKMILQQSLQNKSTEVQANMTQLAFLKSFMDDSDKRNFNFFIFSPSWCASSQEYRAIFEGYFKRFSSSNLTLHSIVIEDPQEAIFDSKVFKELFPHSLQYSHEIVPRFLAFEQVEGRSVIYEEGEALSVLYDKFFKQHRGFLNKTVGDLLPPVTPDNLNPFFASSIGNLPKVAQ